MMYTVDVAVSNVDPYGSESEAILLSRTMDGDGRTQDTDCRAEVSAG